MSDLHVPKDLLVYHHSPGRRLLELAVIAKVAPLPGILNSITDLIVKANMRIIGVSLSSEGDKRNILMFLDSIEATISPQELLEKVKSLATVVNAEIYESPSPSFIIDAYGYPVTIASGTERAVIFSVKWISTAFKLFIDKLGSAGAALLFHLGFMMGLNFGKSIKNMVETVDEYLEVVRLLFQANGFGLVKLEKHIFPSSITLNIRVTDNFEVEAHEGVSKEPVCHFTRGLIAGILKAFFGKDFDVVETRCKAMGHEECVFKAFLK
ncbi:MAG: hypothetical protein J7L38_03750 [Thermoproteales archaeon]|nr:hypothetical protein [Thermoproteales archaeon]